MALDIYQVLGTVGTFTPVIVAFLLWKKINENVQKMDFPQEKKKSISLISAALLFGWFLLVLALAFLDIYHVKAEFFSPLVPIGIVLPGIIALVLVFFSETTKKIVDSLPGHWLISLQLYRILGIVFLWQLEAKALPALYAIPSGYGDIITGLAAPIVGYLYLKKISFSRGLAVLWNIFGILDLAVAVTLGVLLAFPQPFQLIAVATTTEIMTTYPLVLVPVYAVPLAFMLHVFSLRGLLRKNNPA